jgi:hypothetical protein
MTIEIKPAEIVGAAVGDRVTWRGDTITWHGRIAGPSKEYAGRVAVDIESRDNEAVPDAGRRHIEPERLTLAPKTYKVGDEVGGADYLHLPSGAVVVRQGYLPAFKIKDSWFVIDADVGGGGTREVTSLYDRTRTIAWLPQSYTSQNV